MSNAMTHERERLRDMLRRALPYLQPYGSADSPEDQAAWEAWDKLAALPEFVGETDNLEQQILAELARA